jgi:hypothetical protein
MECGGYVANTPNVELSLPLAYFLSLVGGVQVVLIDDVLSIFLSGLSIHKLEKFSNKKDKRPVAARVISQFEASSP